MVEYSVMYDGTLFSKRNKNYSPCKVLWPWLGQLTHWERVMNPNQISITNSDDLEFTWSCHVKIVHRDELVFDNLAWKTHILYQTIKSERESDRKQKHKQETSTYTTLRKVFQFWKRTCQYMNRNEKMQSKIKRKKENFLAFAVGTK